MVQISSDEVTQYANTLRSYKTEMVQVFQEIKARMNALPEVWSSPASNYFLQEFRGFYPVFESFNEGLETYASFLAQTAQSYQENEQLLQSAIE